MRGTSSPLFATSETNQLPSGAALSKATALRRVKQFSTKPGQGLLPVELNAGGRKQEVIWLHLPLLLGSALLVAASSLHFKPVLSLPGPSTPSTPNDLSTNRRHK